MAGVQVVIDQRGFPGLPWVGGHVVGEGAHSFPLVGAITAAVQRQHDEIVRAVGRCEPTHAVGGWLVVKLNRCPFLRPVFGGDEIKNGSGLGGVGGFARVPLCAGRDLGPPVAVDISYRNADVVTLGQVFYNDVFFPGGILVPGNVAGIAQDDVRFFVGIHVSDGDAVADPDLVINRDMPERGQIRRLAKRGPAEQGENENV